MMPNGVTVNERRFLGAKVTHVLYAGLGGHSAVLFALLEAGFMAGSTHEILFVGVEPPPVAYHRRCEDLKVSWRHVPKVAGRGHLKFLFALVNELLATQPDVVYLHGLVAVPAVVLLKLFSRGRKPFVLVRETQANHLKSKRDWIALTLAHRFTDRIVHLTEEAKLGAARQLKRFTKSEKVSVVGNGLDTDYFSPVKANLKLDDEVLHIGMQSRLQSNKDHATLVAAFKLICQRHPTRRFHLHIAGDGSTYQAIEQQVSECGLTEITTMHGMLDQSELREFLNSLDIYVHCTHGETMSTAIMQALSCGLPVIASDVAGVSNMVRPEAGMLYRPGDQSDLADKIDELILVPGAMQEWGGRARRYAVKHYAIAATVRAYHDLISWAPDTGNLR